MGPGGTSCAKPLICVQEQQTLLTSGEQLLFYMCFPHLLSRAQRVMVITACRGCRDTDDRAAKATAFVWRTTCSGSTVLLLLFFWAAKSDETLPKLFRFVSHIHTV